MTYKVSSVTLSIYTLHYITLQLARRRLCHVAAAWCFADVVTKSFDVMLIIESAMALDGCLSMRNCHGAISHARARLKPDVDGIMTSYGQLNSILTAHLNPPTGAYSVGNCINPILHTKRAQRDWTSERGTP